MLSGQRQRGGWQMWNVSTCFFKVHLTFCNYYTFWGHIVILRRWDKCRFYLFWLLIHSVYKHFIINISKLHLNIFILNICREMLHTTLLWGHNILLVAMLMIYSCMSFSQHNQNVLLSFRHQELDGREHELNPLIWVWHSSIRPFLSQCS